MWLEWEGGGKEDIERWTMQRNGDVAENKSTFQRGGGVVMTRLGRHLARSL